MALYAAKKDQAKQLSRQQVRCCCSLDSYVKPADLTLRRVQAATLQAEMMRQQQSRLRRTQQKRDLKSTYRRAAVVQSPALLS